MKTGLPILFLLLCFVIAVSSSSAQQKPHMMAGLPETEASFTSEQLIDYYEVYNNKAVQHVRVVVDRYLKNPAGLDEETSKLEGIDKAYLTGKFNVLSRDPDQFGNTHLLLISVAKPDRVFHVVVYTGNGNRLDAFSVDDRFNTEDMRLIRIRYKKFLSDDRHAL